MRYKTKPFEIDAIQFTGENWDEVKEFCGQHSASYNPLVNIDTFDRVENYWPSYTYEPTIIAVVWDYLHQTWVGVRATDFIIRGSRQEYYPCDAFVFESKYAPVPKLIKHGPGYKVYDDGSYELDTLISGDTDIPGLLGKELTDDHKE